MDSLSEENVDCGPMNFDPQQLVLVGKGQYVAIQY